MFSSHHYVPVMKGKAGELRGVRDLTPQAVTGLTPLFEVPPVPLDHENGEPQRTVHEHLTKFADALAQAWDGTVFVDMHEDDERGVSATGAYEDLFDLLRSRSVAAIPVAGPDRSPAHNDAVRRMAAKDLRGAAVRVRGEFPFDLAADPAVVTDIVDTTRLGPGEIDLMLDFDALAGTPPNVAANAVENLINALPDVNDWRTLTTVFTAFPTSVSDDVATNTLGVIERNDAHTYRLLVARPGLARRPTFGDYGADSPEYFDLDPRMIRPAAKVVYTDTDVWHVHRGGAVRGANSAGFGQFHDLCAALVASAHFHGTQHCTADAYIDACAQRSEGPGNLTTWKQISTGHHLAAVTGFIASQGVP